MPLPRIMGLRFRSRRVRRRSKRALFLAFCSALLLATLLLLLLPRPAPETITARPVSAGNPPEKGDFPGGAVGEQGSPGESPGQGGSGNSGVQVRVEQGAGGAPRYVIEFPEPDVNESVPGVTGEGGDLSGSWSLKMEGSLLGIDNCRLYLLPDGSVRVPSTYDSVFTLEGGRWSYGEDGSFEAQVAAGIKLGSVPGKIPVIILMRGRCARAGLIEGDFQAEPQGEAYRLYYQEGKFHMESLD